MNILRFVNLCILGAAFLVLAGCFGGFSKEERNAIDEARIVFRYFSEPPDGPLWLDAGPYQGGTAVIGPPNARAFWVNDGKAYTVNQAARDVASALEQAPNNVKFDAAFILAASSIGASREPGLEHAIKEVAEATTIQLRFYALNDAAKESFLAGKVENAQKYAEELLTLLPSFTGDWNYGNAVQDANLVLGRIAVREGRIDDAKMYLIESGKGPGSPQMDTFGPNMSLAKDLLEKGQREVVLEYFELCRKFWEMHDGQLDQWSQQVKDGEIPDFGANLVY